MTGAGEAGAVRERLTGVVCIMTARRKAAIKLRHSRPGTGRWRLGWASFATPVMQGAAPFPGSAYRKGNSVSVLRPG